MPDAAPAAQQRSPQLRFDRFILDLDRGSLLLDGNEIALRPKTFAVLRYLSENCARLVSKDELFAAVWPNLAVTDDTLVQSIGELRRALGDDGPRLIRTVPRRGYRFDSDVSVVAAPGRSSTEASPALSAPSDAAAPAEPDAAAPSLPQPVAVSSARPGLRIGRTASITLAVLLAGAVLSGGLVTAWKLQGTLGTRWSRHDQEPGVRHESHDRHSSLPRSERRSDAGVFRRWIDAGHHQRAGPVFRADGDVMERRFAIPRPTRKPSGDRPQHGGTVSGRGQRPPDRQPRARECATCRCGRKGALVGPLRRGAGGRLRLAGQDHHANRRSLGDPGGAGRATACGGQADRKSRSLRLRPARQTGTAATDAREQRGGARTPPACDPARPELCRRVFRTRRYAIISPYRWAGRNRRRTPWAVRRKWQTRR